MPNCGDNGVPGAGTGACFVIDAGSYLVAAFCAHQLQGVAFRPQPADYVAVKGCVCRAGFPPGLPCVICSSCAYALLIVLSLLPQQSCT